MEHSTASPKPVPVPPSKPITPDPGAEPTIASALRTRAMWTISILVGLGAWLFFVTVPKIGVYYFAGLLLVSALARLVLAGEPFGLSARNKFWDVTFCVLLAAGLVLVAVGASALK